MSIISASLELLEHLFVRCGREGEPSQLVVVDIFVNTWDPLKERPLITANMVLFILAIDYPVDKVSCYVSDDGAAMLSFESISKTSEFAKKCVPEWNDPCNELPRLVYVSHEKCLGFQHHKKAGAINASVSHLPPSLGHYYENINQQWRKGYEVQNSRTGTHLSSPQTRRVFVISISGGDKYYQENEKNKKERRERRRRVVERERRWRREERKCDTTERKSKERERGRVRGGRREMRAVSELEGERATRKKRERREGEGTERGKRKDRETAEKNEQRKKREKERQERERITRERERDALRERKRMRKRKSRQENSRQRE
ncbi:cellulose synthase [Tanacetum coccineum]